MPDQHLLQKLLEDHQLIQTNSWTRKAGPTYLHHAGHSLIDHLIIWQSQADNLARQAHPIPTKLAAWRQGGRHLPIAGTYRLQTFHSLNRPTTARKDWDHWTLVQKCHDWWDPQIAQLRHLVGYNLCQVCNVDDLDRMLVAQATTVFPPVAQPCRLAVWQTPVMRGILKAMWQAYKEEWKKPSGAGLRSVLQAWRSFQLFQSKQKAFRKAARKPDSSGFATDSWISKQRHNPRIRAVFMLAFVPLHPRPERLPSNLGTHKDASRMPPRKPSNYIDTTPGSTLPRNHILYPRLRRAFACKWKQRRSIKPCLDCRPTKPPQLGKHLRPFGAAVRTYLPQSSHSTPAPLTRSLNYGEMHGSPWYRKFRGRLSRKIFDQSASPRLGAIARPASYKSDSDLILTNTSTPSLNLPT